MNAKKIAYTTVNSFRAILKGEFLFSLGATKYFGKILYVFLMIGGFILVSLCIDNTLGKVEENKKRIKELQTVTVMKTFEFERHRSRSVTGRLLEKKGSELREPAEPATKICD